MATERPDRPASDKIRGAFSGDEAEDDPRLGLAEKQRINPPTELRQVDARPDRQVGVAYATFRQRHRQATFAAIVCAVDPAAPDDLQREI